MLMLVAFAFAGSTPSIVPFPVRATDAVSGTTFAEQIADLPDHERYAATRDALLSGNVPSFLRSLVPVTLVGGPSAAATTITVFVTRDYLSVGGDDDFVPMPLDFVGAAEVASALGFGLPTRRIVDAIYNAADVQALTDHLRIHPKVDRVWHAGSEGGRGYEFIRREDGGYGCLFSFTLKNPEQTSPKVFDALRVSKGPSLGTNFTLACPYTLLAHYDELEWAESCGVSRWLIRVSAGLEDTADLIARFDEALAKA